jgi:hypothetical protein
MLSSLALILAATCPNGWVTILFYDQRGRPTFPGRGSPPAGFALLALFAYVLTAAVGVLVAISIRRPEIREVSLILLGLSVLTIAVLSSASMLFTPSKLARAGVWAGWGGLACLATSLIAAPS